VVIGDREVKQELLAPRARTGKSLPPMKVEEFIAKLKEESAIGGESYR
jgi:threonyl-tRNA synthetase